MFNCEFFVIRTDNLDNIAIRFHFGCYFHTANGHVHYVGGEIAESWIDVDKLSYFEIKGHLGDHLTSKSILWLYWLQPRMDLGAGLVLLLDDASSKVMIDYHTDGGAVDMYAKEVGMEMSADDQEI